MACLMLDRMIAVSFPPEQHSGNVGLKLVKVQAGCRLNVDPEDPTGQSKEANGLCAQLQARGWALPDLGGIAAQSIAGFLSTGSAGGKSAAAVTPLCAVVPFTS